MRPLRLVVVDFDGTIFNSPEPPSNLSKQELDLLHRSKKNGGCGWWEDLRSLSPPLVPSQPKAIEWTSPKLFQLLQTYQDRKTATREKGALPEELCFVLTGRDRSFSSRIRNILNSLNLMKIWEGIYLKPSFHDNTSQFKVETFLALSMRYPSTEQIDYFDDRVNQGNTIALAMTWIKHTWESFGTYALSLSPNDFPPPPPPVLIFPNWVSSNSMHRSNYQRLWRLVWLCLQTVFPIFFSFQCTENSIRVSDETGSTYSQQDKSRFNISKAEADFLNHLNYDPSKTPNSLTKGIFPTFNIQFITKSDFPAPFYSAKLLQDFINKLYADRKKNSRHRVSKKN